MSGRPDVPRWAAPLIALHWIMAGLLIVLIGLGWWMIHGQLAAAVTFELFQWHKSVGVLVLAFLLARLAIRAVSTAPPHAGSVWERRAAAGAHAALYVLMSASGLSGWMAASAAPIRIPTSFFGLFDIPALWGADQAMFAWMSSLHFITAWGLAALVGAHIVAALKHQFMDRDDLFSRMLPGPLQDKSLDRV